MNLINLLFLILLMSITGCSSKQNDKVQSILVINASNIINDSETSIGENHQLELFFIKPKYLISFSKAKELNELNNLLGLLDIQEMSGHDVSAYYTYNIISQGSVRDLIEITEDTEYLLIVLKKKDQVVAKKIINLYPQKRRMINIELIGKQIKVAIN